MISAKTAAKLRLIQRAGRHRLQVRAGKQGVTTFERDWKILQATATGSTVQAAARYGVKRQTVDEVIGKYEKMARSILGEEV